MVTKGKGTPKGCKAKKEKLPTLSSSTPQAINEGPKEPAQEGTKMRKQSILEKVSERVHYKRWDKQ